MTNKAATETKLGELHDKIATVMTQALDVLDTSQEVYLRKSEQALESGDADLIADLPEAPPEVSAPLLSVITKFLADNKISCVPEESAGMSDLARRLENRAAQRQKRSVGNVVHLHDAE